MEGGSEQEGFMEGRGEALLAGLIHKKSSIAKEEGGVVEKVRG